MGRKKKEIKIKEPVRIREKRLNDGNVSLYLDMYYRGARKKEGLKLYLVPETDAAAKLQNRNTRKLAEQIKAQRILDIQEKGLVNWEDVKKARMTLSAWVAKYTGRGKWAKSGQHEVEAERTGKGGRIPIIYRQADPRPKRG